MKTVEEIVAGIPKPSRQEWDDLTGLVLHTQARLAPMVEVFQIEGGGLVCAWPRNSRALTKT